MGFLKWMGFEPKKIKVVKYDLSPDLIKENNIIHGQANQIAELQGLVARFKAEQAKQKQLKEQKDEEEVIKTYLQNEKKQLNKKNSQKFFSLKAFFTRYLNDENFKNNLNVTTFDRSTNLSKFGDFGFSGNSFVILDKQNNPILRMNELKDIFQSVDALPGDIKSMKIPVNLDKDWGYVENLMKWEAPEIIREEGGFKYAKAKKRPLYELLKEKDAQIQQSYSELEEAETTIIKLQDKLDELEIGYESNEKSGQVARAERVKTAKTVSKIEEMWRDTETELAKMRQITDIQEDEINKIEEELTRLRKKAQDEGVTLKFDEVLKRLKKTKSLFREKSFEGLEENSQKTPQ